MLEQIHIGFLLYPGVTQLDATGPAQVLSLLTGAKIHMIWKEKGPIETDAQFSINATTSFDECPNLNVICIPGGAGQMAIMMDPKVLAFVKRQGEQADYLTSVCSGSLLLAAAGLLDGYKAGCHWAFRDMLKNFGAEPVAERVVRDRNRFTGGGVTAGIDFGLTLAAEIEGVQKAKEIQLFIEYDPKPPFDAGTPEKAGPEIESIVREKFAKSLGGAYK